MNFWKIGILLLSTVLAISACGRGNSSPADEDSGSAATAPPESGNGGGNQQAFSALPNDYEGALPPTNQFVLGILLLEDTENAVTGAQAATMLPLWQVLQSGSIQNQTERATIMTQIEGALTEEQYEAIRAMQLTFADMNEWAQANGIELPQFGQGGGQRAAGQGGQGGQGGAFADMSQEERAAFRQEMQDLSPEERQERLREMGVEVPEGGFQGQGGGQGGAGGGFGRFGILLEPLIELLESKAAF